MITGNTGRYNNAATNQSIRYDTVRMVRNTYSSLPAYPGKIYSDNEEEQFEEGYKPGYENTLNAAKVARGEDDVDDEDLDDLEEEEDDDDLEEEDEEEDAIPGRSNNSRKD